MPTSFPTRTTPTPAALVVEDDAASRELIATVLEGVGCVSHGVGSVEEARLLLTREHPDVVVTDVELPGEDGLSFARWLRAEPATAAVPVLAVTGHADEERRTAARAAGCVDLLIKPLDLGALADRLSALLQNQPID